VPFKGDAPALAADEALVALAALEFEAVFAVEIAVLDLLVD
jgi:hypothetical protein